MKIIVTLTSWVKRIDTIMPTLESILRGTLVPDKIILNLSKTEFFNTSLPYYVDKLCSENIIFEIHWIDGPNTKTFKKLLPTLEKYPDDIVVSIDDDIIYPVDFLKTLVDAFLKDPKHPITVSYYYYKGALIPWGGGTLYKKEFLNGYEKYLDQEIINTYEDDWFYGYMLVLNGVELVLAPDPICYTPDRYRQSTYEHQMFLNHEYSLNITQKALDSKLEAHGVTFEELADKLHQK